MGLFGFVAQIMIN